MRRCKRCGGSLDTVYRCTICKKDNQPKPKTAAVEAPVSSIVTMSTPAQKRRKRIREALVRAIIKALKAGFKAEEINALACGAAQRESGDQQP